MLIDRKNMLSNFFNTTPDGTTIISLLDVLGLTTTMIVDPTTTPYIDNLMYYNPTITTFLFKAGTYKLVNILKIVKNGIRFIGMTGVARDVQIIQTNSNADGIAINANNVILQDLSLTCTYSQKVCLTAASANNCVVSGCYFYGCSDTFTIYYAGPKTLTAGQATLDAYTNRELDTGNVFS